MFAFEHHIFSASTLLKVVEVPLSGSFALQHIPYSPQFDVICKLSDVLSVPLSMLAVLNNVMLGINMWRTSLITGHQLDSKQFSYFPLNSEGLTMLENNLVIPQ